LALLTEQVLINRLGQAVELAAKLLLQTGEVNYKLGMEQKIGRILLDFGL